MSNKSEQPTEHKLREAGEKGDIARSQVFTKGMAMLAWWLALPALAGAALQGYVGFARGLLSQRLLQDELGTRLLFLKMLVVGCILPCVLALVVTVLLGMLQTRGRIARKREWLDFKRINPGSGIKQYFGLQRIFTVLTGFVEMMVVLWPCVYLGGVLLERLRFLPSSQRPWSDPFWAALSTGWKAAGFAILGCACVGVADYLVQVMLWKRRNKMSKDEVKREYRDQDGDPQVKAVRRSLQRGMAQ